MKNTWSASSPRVNKSDCHVRRFFWVFFFFGSISEIPFFASSAKKFARICLLINLCFVSQQKPEMGYNSLANYYIEKKIGRGQFSEVYRAKYLINNTPVALKKVQVSQSSVFYHNNLMTKCSARLKEDSEKDSHVHTHVFFRDSAHQLNVKPAEWSYSCTAAIT